MYKLLKILTSKSKLNAITTNSAVRTFLSQAYNCQEVWNQRLNNPIIQKVKLDDLYYELDQRFQRTRQISAVDVDIFAYSVTDESFIDELVDLVHKLRLSADTGSTLNSTSHAVIRAVKDYGKKEELLNILDDRLNYGVFLDYFTATILMDSFWKDKDYTSGARVASQLMLQEELEHRLSCSLSLLHCYNFLLKPDGWPEIPKPEEPEEEIKVRVKFLRNPFDDHHFDLKDPHQIVGKTLVSFTKNKNDSLNKSLNLLGWSLYNPQKFSEVVTEFTDKNIAVYKEVLDLIPNKESLGSLKVESADVAALLTEQVKQAERQTSEKDIVNQLEVYSKWETERMEALEQQKERLLTKKRLENIDNIKKDITDKETMLWFFENEEQIELDIEAKKRYYPKRWFGNKKAPRKIDAGYVPPEVTSKPK